MVKKLIKCIFGQTYENSGKFTTALPKFGPAVTNLDVMINFWKNRVSCKPLNISGFQNKISFPWDYPFSFRFEPLRCQKKS